MRTVATMLDRGTRTAVVVVAAIMAVSLVGAQKITTGAFDALEARQVAQDAQRVRVGLEGWFDVLRTYGATNSVWDTSYADVRDGDAKAFAEDFLPRDVGGIYALSGVLALGTDGRLRAGGIVHGDTYARPPSGLSTQAELAPLFDRAAVPGAARCGVVDSAAGPFLFCGFAAHRTAGGDDVAGGLVYLRAVAGRSLDTLAEKLDLPVALVSGARAGAAPAGPVESEVGRIGVSTAIVNDSTMALTMNIPAVNGGQVLLEVLRHREIHEQALAVAHWLMILMCGLGAVFLTVVIVVMRAEVRRQIRPLLGTAEKVITTGDRSLRIGSTSPGVVGRLADTVDRMLDAMAGQDAELRAAQEARESQLIEASTERQQAREQSRRRTRESIEAAAATVFTELNDVVERVHEVRAAASVIDERVHSTETTTEQVRGHATAGGRTAEAVTQSLHRVSGIAGLIAGVARQTNLLALNATIEAVRAGEAGRGFAVVAGEVKQLAATTATSTGEIAVTLAELEGDVAAMREQMTAMTDGVAGIGREASGLTRMTDEQREAMSSLDASVASAMSRVESMASAAQ